MGLVIWLLLLILGLINVQLVIIPFNVRSALLLGYFKSVLSSILSFSGKTSPFSGLRRGIACVYHALRARQFVREHRLQLDRATDHVGVDVTLPEHARRAGIPVGCGFEFPLSSMLFSIGMFGLILSNLTDEQQTT